MINDTRGYFGIGVYHPKTSNNIGTLWRSAYVYGASFVFTIGRRYKHQVSDTYKTPHHVPMFHYVSFDEFYESLPYKASVVAIEITKNATLLNNFCHPQQSIYILGAEDYGLPEEVLNRSHYRVEIPSLRGRCLNVAVAGTVVMYDRFVKQN